jgi:hypothetical protein
MRPEWSYILARTLRWRQLLAFSTRNLFLRMFLVPAILQHHFQVPTRENFIFNLPFPQKLFLFETIFHKIFLIKSFVLLTMELSLRTLAIWHVTRPFLAVLWKFNTAPETFAFPPPAPSSRIPAVPSSSNSITSSAASRKISAGKFPISASFVCRKPNLSLDRRNHHLPLRKFSVQKLVPPIRFKPAPLTRPEVRHFFR